MTTDKRFLSEFASKFVSEISTDFTTLVEEYLKKDSQKKMFEYFLAEALNKNTEDIDKDRINGLL